MVRLLTAQYGYYTDQETGLQLLTHRYYDPAEGRFLTRDPIGYAGGMNLYAYVGNNPVNLVDPLGFCGDRPGDSLSGGGPDGSRPGSNPGNPTGFWPNLAQEANPFNPNSALYRQAISIGDFYRGDWKAAARNSGWAQMQESNASPLAFKAYTGTQVLAGAAAAGAVGAMVYESATGTQLLVEGLKKTGGNLRIFQIRPSGQNPIFRIDIGPIRSRGPHIPHWHQWPDMPKHLPWDWFIKR